MNPGINMIILCIVNRNKYIYYNQRPVVLSIIGLTTLLSPQLVKYIPNTLSNTLSFFIGKNVRIFRKAKDSLIFQIKNKSVFVIFTFEALTKCELTTSLISSNRPQ